MQVASSAVDLGVAGCNSHQPLLVAQLSVAADKIPVVAAKVSVTTAKIPVAAAKIPVAAAKLFEAVSQLVDELVALGEGASMASLASQFSKGDRQSLQRLYPPWAQFLHHLQSLELP